MTQEQFIETMQTLYRVWEGTENADVILEDVCNTFATDFFKFDGYSKERQALLRQCQWGTVRGALNDE